MKWSFLLLILDFLFVVHSGNPAASSNCTNLRTHVMFGSLSATAKASRFCNHFGDSQTCRSSMEPYFTKFKETEDAIDKFAERCKTLYSNKCDTCIKMINHLNTYCYSMMDAYELVRNIKKEEFQNLGGYEKIILYQQDWKKYQTLKNINIKNCLREFFDKPERESNNSNEISARDIMEKYYNKYQNEEKAQCTCVEVFEFYRISNEVKSRPEYTLFSLYNNICLMPNYHRENWKRYHYVNIAKSIIPDTKLLVPRIVLFIKYCYDLAQYWCNPKYDNSQWPFNHLTELLGIDEIKTGVVKEVNKNAVKSVGYAMRANLSADDFKNIVSATSDVKTLNTPQCHYEILKCIYELDKYENGGKDSDDFVVKTVVWQFSKPEGVQEKLQMFVNISKSYLQNRSLTNPCEELSGMIITFENVVKKLKWTQPFINEILKQAVDTKRDFLSFQRCIVLCSNIGDEVQRHFNKILHKEKLEKFARNLLSLNEGNVCSPKSEKFNIADKQKLETLLTSILKENINQIVT